MKSYPRILYLILCVCAGQILWSQTKESGPVIEEYGKVWKVDQPDFQTRTDQEFKAVFDVMSSPESHDKINPAIETVARYLNMHAQSGIPMDKLKAVMVVHSAASKDLMNGDSYEAKYGFSNPNHNLLIKLMETGVEIVFCGQSSYSRGITKNMVVPGVQISLSAMTALIQLQDEGYRLIKF